MNYLAYKVCVGPSCCCIRKWISCYAIYLININNYISDISYIISVFDKVIFSDLSITTQLVKVKFPIHIEHFWCL